MSRARHRPVRRKTSWRLTFSKLDELMASPDQPVADSRIGHHLTRVRAGLDSLMRDQTPPTMAWREVADAINILSAATELGIVQDEGGECSKAKGVMGQAGERYMQTGLLRLDGPGARTLVNLLADYEEVARGMPARDFIRCCRRAEKRVSEVLAGRAQSGDRVVGVVL